MSDQQKSQSEDVQNSQANLSDDATYNQQAHYAYQQGAQPIPPTAVSSTENQKIKSKKKRSWKKIIVAVVVILIICTCIGSCSASVVSIANSKNSLFSNNNSGLVEYSGIDHDPSIAVISLDGMISYEGSSTSPDGFKYLLKQAEEDSNIKAVVLQVNSGGGVATAGEEMTEALSQFSKPVVVSSRAINASAAYEISSQADYIYVAKTTDIGAIGTIMEITDLSQLYEKLGIKKETFASGNSKDSTYGNRPLTKEERAYYQDYINEINEPFIQNVAKGRNLDVDQVRKLATGLTWSGMSATKNGIADEIGYFENACDKAASLAGVAIDDCEIVQMEVPWNKVGFNLFDLLFSQKRNFVLDAQIFESQVENPSTRIHR